MCNCPVVRGRRTARRRNESFAPAGAGWRLIAGAGALLRRFAAVVEQAGCCLLGLAGAGALLRRFAAVAEQAGLACLALIPPAPFSHLRWEKTNY